MLPVTIWERSEACQGMLACGNESLHQELAGADAATAQKQPPVVCPGYSCVQH